MNKYCLSNVFLLGSFSFSFPGPLQSEACDKKYCLSNVFLLGSFSFSFPGPLQSEACHKRWIRLSLVIWSILSLFLMWPMDLHIYIIIRIRPWCDRCGRRGVKHLATFTNAAAMIPSFSLTQTLAIRSTFHESDRQLLCVNGRPENCDYFAVFLVWKESDHMRLLDSREGKSVGGRCT